MLIDHRDVERRLGVELTAAEVADLNGHLIPESVAAVEAILGRPIEVAEFTETYLVEWGATRLYLNRTPVVSVDALSVEEVAVTDPDSYIVRPWGIEFVSIVGTTIPYEVEVTYTAGLDADAALALGAVVAARCARAIGARRIAAAATDSGMAGVRALAVEGYSVTYEGVGASTSVATSAAGAAAESASGLTDGERTIVARYRRRIVR